MPVDAVGRDVQGPVLEPLDRDVGRFERGVLHLRVGLDPVDAPADPAPEAVRIVNRALIKSLVALAVEPGSACPLGGNWIALFRHSRFLRKLAPGVPNRIMLTLLSGHNLPVGQTPRPRRAPGRPHPTPIQPITAPWISSTPSQCAASIRVSSFFAP